MKIPKNDQLQLNNYTKYLSVPLVLLGLNLMCFGFLAPQLGFYLDDWVNLAAYQLDGIPGLWNFYLADNRPASAWMYVVLFPVLGVKALNWHILTLVLRWVTALVFWRFLRTLWPKQVVRSDWIAMLFTIYPVFFQQPSAVTYTQQWVCFSLFMLSLFTMLSAIRSPRHFWAYTLLGTSASCVNLITMEYFVGLELLRPLFLWFYFSAEPQQKTRLSLVLKSWIPYLAAIFLFILWRLVYVPGLVKDRNEPYVLVDLFRQPLQTSLRLIEMGLQDLVHILISSWYRTLEPEIITFRTPSSLISWGLVVLTGMGMYLFSRYGQKIPVPAFIQDSSGQNWIKQALLIGFLGILLGALPGWMIGRWSADPSGIYNDRFAMGSMVGASIFLVALMDSIFSQPGFRVFVLCSLLGLAVGSHYRSENNYRWSWTYQQRFYWQLYWRAPMLNPGTVIISERELFAYMGRWPTAFAINLMYPQESPEGQANYWFFLAEKDIGNLFSEFSKGIDLTARYRSFTFKGNSRNALVIHYDQQKSYCLWVLNPKDGNNPELTARISEINGFSNLETIKDISTMGFPPPALFGLEPDHTWCYYYQKADLARQIQAWDRIPGLWMEAAQKNLRPNSGVEYIPYIESFAHLGEFQRSVELTQAAMAVPTIKDMSEFYCSLWNRLEIETNIKRESPSSLAVVHRQLGCR